MHPAQLKENGGHKYLVVYYDKQTGNFDDVIRSALQKHRLDIGEMPVLCLPVKDGICGNKT